MFSIGEKVVYPMYGAGVIEDKTELIIDGVGCEYFVLKICVGDLKISVAPDKMERLGIRKVMLPEEVMDIVTNTTTVEMADNWNQRYKDNLEKIKTGELVQVVEVYKTLMEREKNRSLSSAEKKMLGSVKHIVISEMMLTQDISKLQAEKLLERAMPVTA